MQPLRRQPTRLPHPWDSPSKNTGVGCHFLLQCMKVKSESEVAQSCSTLSNPMDCSSIQGIFQARVLEWGAIAFSKDCHYPISILTVKLQQPQQCDIGERESNEVLQTSNDFIEAGVLQTVQDSNHKKGLCKHSMILYI